MKIFIHEKKGSFSDGWIKYCHQKGIAFEVVDCFDTDIISTVSPGDVLLWHWDLNDSTALTFARHIIAALEEKGVRVYPELKSCWPYDDKIAEKYLLEAIGAPQILSFVFYNQQKAKQWAGQVSFPKVFKLRKGAGSENVKLVKNKDQALRLIGTAFGQGFVSKSSYFNDMKTKVRKIKSYEAFKGKLKRLPSVIIKNTMNRIELPRERGYVYFQEFLPNNSFDTRITVIGDRAFGFIRRNRPNDFRASGSGIVDYDLKKIDPRCVKIAFEVSKRLGTQSLALDFIFDLNQEPKIVEISYCFCVNLIHGCAGYWDSSLKWIPGRFDPEVLILEDLLRNN